MLLQIKIRINENERYNLTKHFLFHCFWFQEYYLIIIGFFFWFFLNLTIFTPRL